MTNELTETKQGESWVPDVDWPRNKERIRQLWPTAMWPEDLRALAEARLGPLNQVALKHAIEQVKVQYSSHQPELKWFLAEHDKFCEKLRSASPPQPKPRRYTVVWTVDRGGRKYEYACTYDTVEEARRHAQAVGGHVLDDGNPVVEQALRDRLIALPRQRIAQAVALLRTRMNMCQDPLPSRIDQWPAMAVGAVAGAVECLERRERAAR